MYTHEVTTVNHSKQGGNYKRSKVNNVFFSPPRNTLPTLGTTEKNEVNIHRNETAMSNVNTNKETATSECQHKQRDDPDAPERCRRSSSEVK